MAHSIKAIKDAWELVYRKLAGLPAEVTSCQEAASTHSLTVTEIKHLFAERIEWFYTEERSGNQKTKGFLDSKINEYIESVYEPALKRAIKTIETNPNYLDLLLDKIQDSASKNKPAKKSLRLCLGGYNISESQTSDDGLLTELGDYICNHPTVSSQILFKLRGPDKKSKLFQKNPLAYYALLHSVYPYVENKQEIADLSIKGYNLHLDEDTSRICALTLIYHLEHLAEQSLPWRGTPAHKAVLSELKYVTTKRKKNLYSDDNGDCSLFGYIANETLHKLENKQ